MRPRALAKLVVVQACLLAGQGCAPREKLVLVAACPVATAKPSTTPEVDAASVSWVFKPPAPTLRADSACREVPYDVAKGPRLFDVLRTDDEGSADFYAELEYPVGARFVTVVDEENDAPPNQLPLEVVVAEVSEEDGLYRISTRFPLGFFSPSRVVGPLADASQQLVGRADESGRLEIGKPQVLYRVWLEQGVLEQVVMRCSRTVLVEQLWLVTQQRTCIRSAFERIEGNL